VLFDRHFGTSGIENQKDVEARERRKAAGVEVKGPRRNQRNFELGKRQVRNDFAHFNVLAGGRAPNLTYLTNAIRALLSYDRKLKNAVSKAVADIVLDDGLEILWEMIEDRLKKPTVLPKLETHLTMVKLKDGFDPRFALPQASVRYTSMVKALFDFSPGGYRELVMEEGEWTQRGKLGYPLELRDRIALHKIAIPDPILNERYPALRLEPNKQLR
jgi:hypothetical protein